MGASGVIAANADYTQPQIPIIPGFALVGGGTNTAITNCTTLVTNLLRTPTHVLLSHGDDYLINARGESLRALMIARTGAGGTDPVSVALTDWCGIPWHVLAWRHVPIANNDSTQLTLGNGPTQTFGPRLSKVVYFYATGAITREMAIPTPKAEEVGGGVTIQQPQRSLPASATPGPALIKQNNGGTILNLRGIRR
jgi:hypothetical protein